MSNLAQMRLLDLGSFFSDTLWAVFAAELAGGTGKEKESRVANELELKIRDFKWGDGATDIDPIALMNAIRGLITAVVMILNLIGVFRR